MILIILFILGLLMLSSYNFLFGNLPSLLVIIFILLFSIIFIYLVSNDKKNSFYSFPIILGYLFRLSLIFLDIYGKNIFTLPNSGGDSEGFYLSVVEYASKGIEIKYGGKFALIMGSIAKLVGVNRLLLQYINMLFSIVAIFFVIKSIDIFDTDKSIKLYSIYLISLLPNYAILSSIFLRESLISLCVSISIYYFLRWINYAENKSFIKAMVFSFFGAIFHSGIVTLAAGFVIIRFLYDDINKKFCFTIKNTLITVFIMFVLVYIYNNYFDTFFRYFGRASTFREIATNEAFGGSSYAKYVGDSSSIPNMMFYTIPRIIYFLFSPFVWQWRGISDIIAALCNSLFYISVVANALAYICINNQKNRTTVIALCIVALTFAFVHSWGTSNTGTAIRHRDKMISLYVILWSISKSLKIKTKTYATVLIKHRPSSK